MPNFFPMSTDLQKIVDDTLNKDNPYLATIGLDFIYLGTDKQSNVVTISKSSPLINYIAKKDELIFIIIYEEAFDRLDPEQQKLIIANALNFIEFNSETNKTTINKGELDEGTYLKYKEKLILSIFAGRHAIRQIEEEKKEEKKNKKSKKV